MGRFGANLSLVDGNTAIIFFIDIEVLDQAFLNAVVEIFDAKVEFFDVLVCDTWSQVVYDDVRPTNPPTIRRYVNSFLGYVEIDGDELADVTAASQFAVAVDELARPLVHTEEDAVEEDHMGCVEAEFLPRNQVDVLHTKIKGKPFERLGLVVGCDVCHEGQTLNKSTGLAFWCIGWAKHAPLRCLQRTWTTHLPSLLELTANTRHHADCRNVRQAGKHRGHACPCHFESFHGPVSRRDCSLQTVCYGCALHVERNVKRVRAVSVQILLRMLAEAHVEALEDVFKEKGNLLSCGLDPFVAVVVTIVRGDLCLQK